MTSKSDLDTIFDGCRDVANVAHQISEIARAAGRLGLPVSKELHMLSERLHRSSDGIRNAFGAECADSVRRAEESTRNMVMVSISALPDGATEPTGWDEG